MGELRQTLHVIFDSLNRLKIFEAGYSSDMVTNEQGILIEHKGSIYKLTLEHLEDGELTHEVIDKYKRGNQNGM